MPLLEITLSKKIDTLCSLEESTAIRVEQYASFLKVPADEVINASLEHVFTKDKEFQAYLDDREVGVGFRRCDHGGGGVAGNGPASRNGEGGAVGGRVRGVGGDDLGSGLGGR